MLFPIAVAFHPAALALDLVQTAEDIVEKTNRFRIEERVAQVVPQKALAGAAREYAQFLAATDRFGHTADGSKPSERVRRQGYEYCMVSENIAYQFRSQGFKSPEELAQRFVEGWKGSPGHRANLRDREATEIGVAVVQSDHTQRYYAVQVFARPHRARGAPC